MMRSRRALRALHLVNRAEKGLVLAKNPAEEPGKIGTSAAAPRLTKLARRLHLHTRNRSGGLALASALV
jgi:hypothetical protein